MIKVNVARGLRSDLVECFCSIGEKSGGLSSLEVSSGSTGCVEYRRLLYVALSEKRLVKII